MFELRVDTFVSPRSLKAKTCLDRHLTIVFVALIMWTTVSMDSDRTERRSVRHRSEAQERIEAAAMEMEMQGTNEESVFQVGSAVMAMEREELEQEHIQLESRCQRAAEALQAAQQVDPSEDKPFGSIEL